jgi:hypothetical protein
MRNAWRNGTRRCNAPGDCLASESTYLTGGLARFEVEDARWFFGREEITDRLTVLAAEDSTVPLMLVGPSGAGKSSLLRAGLLPRLEAAEIFEPGAEALDDLRQLVAAARPAIIVDQLETVFTQCPDETQRREFISAVCDLARSTLVVVAMRADFYDHAIRYPGLVSALQTRQVVLGAMTAEQVGRAPPAQRGPRFRHLRVHGCVRAVGEDARRRERR